MEYDVAPIVIGSVFVGIVIGFVMCGSIISDGYAKVTDSGNICIFQDKTYKMVSVEEVLNDEK